MIPTIILCLKCLETGHLVTTSKRKPLTGPGNFLLKRLNWIKTGFMLLYLKDLWMINLNSTRKHTIIGFSGCLPTASLKDHERIISGKWANLVPVAPAQKYILTFVQTKREKHYPDIP